MKAGLRWGVALLAAGLMLGPAPVLAQDASDAEANQPAAIGPRELQNFSLQGTVTRRADPPAEQSATPPAPEPRTEAQAPPAATQERTATAEATRPTAERGEERPAVSTASNAPAPRSDVRSGSLRESPPSSSVTVALPPLGDGVVHSTAAATPASAPALTVEPGGTLAPPRGLPMLPWLLAALALGAGAAFLFWRNRGRPALAGGPEFSAFTAPEPAPVPRAPAPAPRAAPTPAPKPAPQPPSAPPPITGLVSTRLRPWVEIGFKPMRCIVNDDSATIDFEIELFNSGSAPARAVLLEASMFNASNNQDRQLEAFFSNPVGEGERIVAIQPLNKVNLRTQVVTSRAAIQIFNVGDRQVFVPVIAFNALYRWSSGEGQTSSSYLLGRDTKSEKMAPFRIDLGPRMFRGVGARLLPMGVRR